MAIYQPEKCSKRRRISRGTEGKAVITATTISNFKGIGERFRLPIRPLTLLFGPNGGGKSTILQALHYAREVIDKHNLDAERATSGAGYVELGGFQEFVHNHNERLPIVLRLELTLPPRSRWLAPHPGCFPTLFTAGDVCLSDMIRTTAVEITIRKGDSGIFVESYAIDINGHPLATILCTPNVDDGSVPPPPVRRLMLRDINYDHPLFTDPKINVGQGNSLLEGLQEMGSLGSPRQQRFCLMDGPDADALPDLDLDLERDFALPIAYVDNGGTCEGEDEFCRVMSVLMRAPGRILRDELRALRYIGPLRDLPSLDYVAPRQPEADRWVAGLAAWDEIATDGEPFLANVNAVIGDPRGLNLGYQIQLKQVELRGRRTTPVLVKRDGRGRDIEVQPRSTGVGLSQVIPVVVAALSEHRGITIVEQPELHLHPRVQSELGDVLILGALGPAPADPDEDENELNVPETSSQNPTGVESVDSPSVGGIQEDAQAWRESGPFIIETHSEHMILRILRRIRETTRGTPHAGIAVTPDDISVCYVSQEGGQSVPRTMRIDDQGEFIEPWPDSFFEQDFYERFS